MTASEVLLQNLSEWKPGEGRQTLVAPDLGNGWAALLTADRADQLGCLVWELTLRRADPPAEGDAESLAAWAGRAAERVTGLLEPLKVVEVDAPRLQAMLRSEAPAQRGDNRFYYEVLLKGAAEANVRRYHGSRQPSQRREQVAFALTYEAIAKLAGDLTAEK
jgi:hypothetical protein